MDGNFNEPDFIDGERKNISDEKVRRSLLSIFAFIALVFFVSAGVGVYRYVSAVNDYTAETDGVVTGVKVKTHRSRIRGHSRISRSYYPKFEYTVDGTVYQKTGHLSYNESFCVEGNPVTVLYDPDNPKRCCLKGDIPGYKTGLFYAAGSAAVGIFIFLSGKRLIYSKGNKSRDG
ncbi:MAG: DUF3592 domain-containing protein [Ruminococcus sp.]|nr:DUF3592 domain-containing protein [Ruminococcus sp.]